MSRRGRGRSGGQPARPRRDAAAAASPLELTIERPVAGGRMLARADGRVVLVAGAIPGETVRARIERVERGVAFARVEAVLAPSPDRRPPPFDPACGGGVYAHIDLARQVVLKRDVILDALRRGAGLAWDRPLAVAASPERGYRLRARLHVRDGRVGFFREASHALCDAGPSAQLDPRTLDAVARLVAVVEPVLPLDGLEVSENLDGSERAVHLHLRDAADVAAVAVTESLAPQLLVDGITGVTVAAAVAAPAILAGTPTVGDELARLVDGAPPGVSLRRHAASFFQGNRFLIAALTSRVRDAVAVDGPVWDLYAGVGLFAAAVSAGARERVTAVEGDPISGRDLRANAAAFAGRLAVETRPVEDVLATTRLPADATVILDPPRTGLSKDVSAALAASAVRRLVYVSCDVATLARDLKVFRTAGFEVIALDGFDLFPNTAHVETLAVLQRR